MPNWLKHALWVLIALIALANWRSLGTFFHQVLSGAGDAFSRLFLGFEDPFVRFLFSGILVVAIVAMWVAWCRERGGRRHRNDEEK